MTDDVHQPGTKYGANVERVLRDGIHFVGEIVDGEAVEKYAMPQPKRVEIKYDDQSGGWFLFRWTDERTFCGDTWHLSLEEAIGQAESEYGLSADDFERIED